MIRATVVGVHPMLVAIPPQGTSADELIGDPAPAVIKPGVMDGHDIGVVEPRHRPGLAEESLHDPFAGIGLFEHLHCHVAVEPRIVGPKHLPETAVAQPLAQLKPPETAERSRAPGLHPVDRLGDVGRRRKVVIVDARHRHRDCTWLEWLSTIPPQYGHRFAALSAAPNRSPRFSGSRHRPSGPRPSSRPSYSPSRSAHSSLFLPAAHDSFPAPFDLRSKPRTSWCRCELPCVGLCLVASG